jgi:hypothetical protein
MPDNTITIDPADSATDIAADSIITLTANEDAHGVDSFDLDEIIILKDTDASGTDIPFNATMSGNVIIITPISDFGSLQQVYVDPNDVFVAVGVDDFQQTNATFTTADTVAPIIIIDPADRETFVAASSSITLTANEDIRLLYNSGNITNANVGALITLKNNDANGADITFAATISGNVITITPTLNFDSLQQVYVGIGATIEDTSGNIISATNSTFVATDTSVSPQLDFIAGVTNATGIIAGLSAIGSIAESLSSIFTTLSAPSDFIIPDLAGNGSASLGAAGSSGATFGTGSIVNEVQPSLDTDMLNAGILPGSWESLDFVINKALNNMDWTTLNADPGNPNILEAYRFAGRGFTEDGGTGQFSWAAAFATWVLVKSGFTGLRTMAPSAFSQYGIPVRFHGPRELEYVQKWDIVVFTSNVNIQHVGFIKSFNPDAHTMEIVGGDQADTVKITTMPYSAHNPLFRVTHVRRLWAVSSTSDSQIATGYRGGAPGDVNPVLTLPVTTQTINDARLIERVESALNNIPTQTRLRNRPR